MFKWLGGIIDSNEKELKRLQPIVSQINELEAEFERLSDAELRAKTDEFKERLESGSPLDELLPEAFAAVREAAKRTIGQRHFDVQLMGGIVLHQGKIAEMKTGEGKTLVATLPLYLNCLTGQGCHLVTVNDYLARRDPYWMGPIYHALGVSVASIYPQQTPDDHTPSLLYDPSFDSGDNRWPYFRPISRREAYGADITYGTSSDFGFDYLRDNMAIDLSHCVQREQNYSIVDEVDNLLIDEARTPLIISAPDVEAGQKYKIFARVVPRLKNKQDYEIKEKEHSVDLNDVGYANVERMLRQEGILKSSNFYDPANADLHRHLRNALNAKELYKRDQQYMVKDGQVIIVDEFTGRLMLGRRYSEGLHQAIEAKEGVKVQQESKTYGTVTIQNYFRMYQKLAGMTGTALTEAEEFHKIYSLEVIVIPTNKPLIREDFQDQIYKDEEAKFRAVVREIEQLHKEGRPVLIGTTSIEKSEYLSELLKRKGIPYEVLNAKYHEKEAYIVAQAGQPGAATVATNMAGRGVDIVLGGKEPTNGDKPEWREKHNKVIELGGLHIIGTERHEARRIDNQLRGRAGRQGDPGSSRFYVSLADDIVRRFGGDRIKTFMEWAGIDEDTPIENALVNKAIADVQKRVEGYHFDIRKHLVEYDDVVNQQRELIYSERKKVLSGADLKSNILSMIRQETQVTVAAHQEDDVEGLIADVSTIFPLPPAVNASTLSQLNPKQIEDKLIEVAEALYEERENELGSDNMRVLERLVMLRTIDSLWVEHLTMMEHMRQDAGLYGMGRQRDPLVIYKNEGYKQFQVLLSTIQHEVAHTVYHVGIVKREAPQPAPVAAQADTNSKKKQLKVSGKKIGRNDPCPCGSGKKYKHCCGR
ncbi:MAG TPA: preprotein translocase subunit SecA [Dehalococcoidia bacterium]|jgi:preprotein translocase subunit SecA|nr:preprotein translocase subunit SecA [Dehalococcoidia bacterium]